MSQVEAALNVQLAQMGDLALEAVDLNGDLWFYAPSLAKTLGMRDASAVARLVKDDEKCVRAVVTKGGKQEATLIHESGFYRLVFTSRSPVAERLRRWVLYDMLPLYRKTGQWRLTDQIRRFGLSLDFSEDQWEWLRHRPEFQELLPLALAGYSCVQISQMLGYSTKYVTAAARIKKLRSLGFLPAKITSRTAQLEILIKAKLAQKATA